MTSDPQVAPPSAIIYLIRHGETNENRNKIIQGHLDTLLNEDGRLQAGMVGRAMKEVPIDVLYSSDLKRAAETAEAVLAHHPGMTLQRQYELRERNMGEMQGKVYHRAFSTRGGETVEAFEARALGWWDRYVIDALEALTLRDVPYHIVATTHGGFVSTLVRALIRRDSISSNVVVWTCLNASVTTIEVVRGGGKGKLTKYSGVEHLSRMEKDLVQTNVDTM